jgi:hypothetical protein
VIQDQFPFPVLEGPQIGIVGADDSHLRVSEGDIAIEVEGVRVPLGIVEDPIAPEVQPRRFGMSHEVAGPPRFAATNPTRKEAFPGERVPGPGVHAANRRDLRRREARGGVVALAEEARGVEPASARISDHPVPSAVKTIAGRDDGLVQHGQLRRGERRILSAMGRKPGPQEPDVESHPVVARRAGHDAVVVARVSLGFGESLMTAGRTAGEVREAGESAVVVPNDELCHLRHHMDRAVAPIVDLLRMAQPEPQIATLMTRVGSCGCIPQ